MSKNSETLRQEKYVRMTTTPVEKLILKLAIPTIMSMLVTTLYNLADTFFVSSIGGKEGTYAIAAVSVSLSIMSLIQATGFFIGQGAANYISRALGKQDTGKADEMAATGFVLAAGLGLLLMLIGEVFLEPIAKFLCAARKDKGLIAPTVQYLRWIFVAAPFMTSAFAINNQLRFQGNAFYAMIGVVSGAVLNVGLDPLFIHVFGMGVQGASAATAISQAVSFCILFLGTRHGDNLRIHPTHARISKENLHLIVQGGLPSLMRQGAAAISVMVLNRMAGLVGGADPTIGEATLIAAFGLVNKIMMFLNNVVIGLGQGYQPVCGFNYGAGLYSRVRKAFWFLVRAVALWCIVVTVVVELFTPQVVGMFPDAEPRVRELAVTILRLQCAMLTFNAFIVPSNMSQQTMGMMVPASTLALARQGLFMIPLAILLPKFFGLIGLELAQPIGDLLTFILAIILQSRVLRMLNQPDRTAEDA
ncbi:MAG: MATE family efflux transporter [Oscillospiraceae bacterium]|nr:MATE family efflux transporter [Oscillospiraceae bacterium]MBQ6030244.1 MATE family efflux transporter [Oscillospiraceae bacterium]MBQ9374314.1 MATE family efflux transporter [Oscillospiraceae bacterium]